MSKFPLLAVLATAISLCPSMRGAAITAAGCVSGGGTSSSDADFGILSSVSSCLEPPGVSSPQPGFASASAAISASLLADGIAILGSADSLSVVFGDPMIGFTPSSTTFSGSFFATLATAGSPRTGVAIFDFSPAIFGPGGGAGNFTVNVSVGPYSSNAGPGFCAGDFCGPMVQLPITLGTGVDVLFSFSGDTFADFAAGSSQIVESAPFSVRFAEQSGAPVAARIVPEPSTVSLLAVGVVLAFWRRRRVSVS